MARGGWNVVVFALAVAVLVGCGGTKSEIKTVPVTGVVTLDGQPVAGATVTFSPKSADGRAASGITDQSGRYTLTTAGAGEGAVPGSYAVAITKVAAQQAAPANDPRAAGGNLSPEEAKMIMGQQRAATGAVNELPAKYAKADTSQLEATVKEGEKNEINFELTSR